MSAYCTIADVGTWLPLESVASPARLVASVSTAADTLSLNGHGLALDDAVQVRADAGGTLPSPLVAGTTYYAIPVTDSTFQLAATAGGAAINLTTAGSNTLLVTPLPWATWIERGSNELECTLPSAAVPLSAPYPAIVVEFVAGLVAEKALGRCGVSSAAIAERLKLVRSQLDLWRKNGITLRGASVPTATNLAVRGTATTIDTRGWVSALGDRYIP